MSDITVIQAEENVTITIEESPSIEVSIEESTDLEVTIQESTPIEITLETGIFTLKDHKLLTNIGNNTHVQIDTHISNKSPDINLGTSDVLYPTQNAVKTYVDTEIDGKVEFDYLKLAPGITPPDEEGVLWWNEDEFTLNINTGLGPVLQTGQEQLVLFFNDTGVQIDDGSILHPIGGTLSGGTVVPTVELAKADKFETCQGTLFVATSNVLNNTLGFGTRFGKVRGLDTTPFGAGAQIWLSDTNAGEFTNAQPQFPSYVISMGGTLNNDAIDGEIFVSITTRVEDTIANGWDGAIRETFDFRISSTGGVITGTLSNPGTLDDLTCMYSTGFFQFDTSTSGTIVLTAGTDTVPQANYVYIPESTKVLTVSTTEFPDDIEHCKVAYIVLRSATSTEDDDALVNQNWNDHIKRTDDNGHILHIAERIRQDAAKWNSGALGSCSVSGTPSDVYVSNTSGKVYQLHKQTFPAHDTSTGDKVHVVNDFTVPFKELSNLNTQILDANGAALSNSSFSFVMWGLQNKTGEESHLMINVPTGSYLKNNPDAAVEDASNHSVYDIPAPYASVGFLIARFTFQLESNGTDWTLYDTQDLRGFQPSNAAGGSSGGGGVSEFTALTDTPSSYIDQAGKVPTVNDGETALEFITLSTSHSCIGGLISNDGTTPDEIIDITELFPTISSDGTQALEVSADSLNITTAADWASGSVPTLTSASIFVWADYNSGTQIFILDDVTGSNIAGAKRRVGSLITDSSGDIIPFINYELDGGGIDTIYKEGPIIELNASSQSAGLKSVSVPIGINMDAKIAGLGATTVSVLAAFVAGDMDDFTPVLATIKMATTSSGGVFASQDGNIKTNTSGQIRLATNKTFSTYLSTFGFIDQRKA